MNPEDSVIPRIPVGDGVEAGVDWLKDTIGPVFDLIDTVFSTLTDGLTELLIAPPALVMILVFALIAGVVRSWQLAVGTALTFLLVLSMEQWGTMMETMALVLIATLIAVILAVPLGVLAARSRTVSALVRPLMDFMQTMPAFVYLIPMVVFFSIGVVPGIVATIIFALPPGVRMTELGIRQVDAETVEAGEAFGATPWQILSRIQFPLAVPTIMAGVNQVIMLALSMGVIAGMVGAPGLGKQVVDSISSLDLAQGVEAGLAVVILAVYLDRLTAALGDPSAYPTSVLALIQRSRAQRATAGTGVGV